MAFADATASAVAASTAAGRIGKRIVTSARCTRNVSPSRRDVPTVRKIATTERDDRRSTAASTPQRARMIFMDVRKGGFLAAERYIHPPLCRVSGLQRHHLGGEPVQERAERASRVGGPDPELGEAGLDVLADHPPRGRPAH